MKPLSVTWSGFRGFRRPTSLFFPGITLLIGRNNVGKTSAYAPLLLLRQTLDARNPRTALLSRGQLIDAGPYRDFVSDHDTSRAVSFTVGIPGGADVQVGRRTESARIGSVELRFRSGEGNNVVLESQRIIDSSGRPLVTRTRETGTGYYNVTSRVLPDRQSVGRPLREVTELRSGMRTEQPEGFLFRGYGGLLLPSAFREDPARWAKIQNWYNAASNLYHIHSQLNNELVHLLRQISYVGPLRSLPQRTYRLAAEAPGDVGHTGESAPEILFRQRSSRVPEEVDAWLTRLGYGTLEFDSLGDEYFQVHLNVPSGARVNLAHCGVGLSQLLPLLVQGTMARAGSTMIAQQPEIHLNPAQQCIATDFLVKQASRGVRVVIETHSEHVLLRLRRRIAEGELDADGVAVYYVDYDKGQTSIQKIELGPLGEVDRNDWPVGFFEEQLEDSFGLATAQSTRRQVR